MLGRRGQIIRVRSPETQTQTKDGVEGMWPWGTFRPKWYWMQVDVGEEAVLCSRCGYGLECACFW